MTADRRDVLDATQDAWPAAVDGPELRHTISRHPFEFTDLRQRQWRSQHERA